MTRSERRADLVAAIAGSLSLFAVYWDDAWHTDFGRDTFFVPPHLLLYAAVGVTSAAAIVALRFRRDADRYVWMLVLTGVGSVGVSAPIDEMWHRWFGRDAVLWSPPHLLGVIGTFLVLAALARPNPRRSRLLSAWLGGLMLLAPMVAVMEYETDVPQFSVVWYLPVLTFGLVLAMPFIAGRTSIVRTTIEAALAATALRIAITMTLALMGRTTPIISPILAVTVLVALSVVRLGRWHPVVVLLAVHVVYLPYLAVVPGGVTFSIAEVALSLVLSLVGSSIALWAVTGDLQPSANVAMPAVIVLVLVAVSMVGAPNAWGHDPGKGETVGSARFEVRPDGKHATVHVELMGIDCAQVQATSIVGRRAGVVRRTAADRVGCSVAGSIEFDRPGRWFVYIEVVGFGRVTESWIPVSRGGAADGMRDLYIPPESATRNTIRNVAGAAILMASASILMVFAATSRRQFQGDQPNDPSSPTLCS